MCLGMRASRALLQRKELRQGLWGAGQRGEAQRPRQPGHPRACRSLGDCARATRERGCPPVGAHPAGAS